MRRLPSCCTVLILIASLGAGEAPLSVEEAISLALANNERSEIARERLRQADAARREAWAMFLPNLSATGSYSRTRDNGNFEQGSLGLAVRILDPSSFPQLRQALALYEANRLDASELKRVLAYDVADAFAGVLAAEQLVEAAEKRLAVNDEALKQSRLNAEAGLVARSEVTRTEVEQATAAGGLVKARATASRSRLSLGYLLGISLTRPLMDPAFPQADLPQAQALMQEALRTRQDLHALSMRGEAARAASREPLMDALPKLSLQGTASDGVYLGGATSSSSDMPVDHPSWSLSLVATWQLYDGGARYGRRERYASMAREANLNEMAARRRMELDIATALEDLATARATMATAETRTQAAQRNQSETHTRFTSGLATAIEEADATATAFEALAELTRSRYALWQSYLAINRTVGRWPTGKLPAGMADDGISGK